MTPDSVLPGASPGQDGPLAPMCSRCGRRHLPDLRCWVGRYARDLCEQVYRQRGRWCVECGKAGRRTRATSVDHLVARSRGGTDDLRNLQPACARHNYGKGNRIAAQYRDVLGIGGNGIPVSERFRS